MALKREIYTGAGRYCRTAENVSEDPVILDSYAWRMNTPRSNLYPALKP